MGAETKNFNPEIQNFAKQILVAEAMRAKRAGISSPDAFSAWQKFRLPLGKLIGRIGVHSLFSRALALAGREVSWLRTLRIKTDGMLNGLNEVKEKLNADQIARGEIVLLERLLELLVTFIGAPLTLRLIEDIWPDGNFGSLDFK